MATLDQNPLIVTDGDAAPATIIAAGTKLRLRSLRWIVTAGGAATDNIVLQDGNSNEITTFVNATGVQADHEQDFSQENGGFNIDGLVLSAEAGTSTWSLYVYLA